MTPERLRECLGVLNWSTAALAAMAQISPVTARRIAPLAVSVLAMPKRMANMQSATGCGHFATRNDRSP